MKINFRLATIFSLFCFALWVTACGGGSGSSSSDDAADYAGDDIVNDDAADDTADDAADDTTISPEPLTIVHDFPPVAAPDQIYTYSFQAVGGVPPYRNWRLAAGLLPAGFSLDAETGVLSGIAKDDGEKLFYFVIEASDSSAVEQSAQETFGMRVGDPTQPGPLLKKARAYQEIYLARHNSDGLSVTADHPDDPNGDYWFSDLGDACFIHGNASVGAAFHYAAEPTDEALENVRLHVRGMDLLNRVNGVPGLLSRSYMPKDGPMNPNEFTEFWPANDDHIGVGEFADYYWKGDVSIDQYSGELVGLALTYDLVPDEEVRADVRRTVEEIADYLWQGDLLIYDADGVMTKYGDFRCFSLEGVPAPNGLSSAASLAWFRLAQHVSDEPRFAEHYQELVERGCPDNVEHFLWVYLGYLTKHYNVYMAFENMFVLARLEDFAPLREKYLAGFKKLLWESTGDALSMRRAGVEANPTYTAWYLSSTGQRDPVAVMKAIWQMDVFGDAPLRDHYVQNSADPNIAVNPEKPDWALEPLPSNQRVPDMCIWHRTPYGLDGGDDSGRERTGHDYLTPYWTLRYLGWIGPDW